MACRARDREADDMQARGKALLDRGQFDDARVLLDGALARHVAVEDHVAASRDAICSPRCTRRGTSIARRC